MSYFPILFWACNLEKEFGILIQEKMSKNTKFFKVSKPQSIAGLLSCMMCPFRRWEWFEFADQTQDSLQPQSAKKGDTPEIEIELHSQMLMKKC